MITTNTDGNPISAGLISAIQGDKPRTLAGFWYNDAELDCAIVDVKVSKGSCGGDTFMIGDVIGDILTATVKNLSVDLKGEKIEYHIGYLVGSDYEYISLGIFTVAEVKTTRYETYITAYSGVIADTATRLYTEGLVLPNMAQLASRIAGQMDCLVTFDEDIDTTPTITAVLEGLTVYQALQILAVCSGGYITNTNDGNVRVRQFASSVNATYDTGRMTSLPQIAEQPYTVESIGVVVSEATTDNEGNPIDAVYFADNASTNIILTKQGTDYYWQDEQNRQILANLNPESADIFFSCPYMTAEIFNANIRTIKGYSYSPATVNMTLGDPRLEGCDVVEIIDVDGNSHSVPCHSLTHSYTGGFTSNIKSCDASDNANSIGTALPVTQRLQNLSRATGRAQATANNAYKIADDTNQYFWFVGDSGELPEGVGTGAHITETPQQQYLADPENGGGNLLARSNGIAVRDGITELATFGASGAQIGRDEDTHTTIDYHSLQLVDKEGNTYLHVSDLRNEEGVATVSDRFYGDGSTRSFQLSVGNIVSLIEVKVGTTVQEEGTDYTFSASTITFVTAPRADATIVVQYTTTDYRAKAFTFGTRGTNNAIGAGSFSEGYRNVATGGFSHAEGYRTEAIGRYSHAEGNDTSASGFCSHAEGSQCFAQGTESHAEGRMSGAYGFGSHAENQSDAYGQYSHTEGYRTKAYGNNSHAGGYFTIANGENQTVIGRNNIPDTTSAFIIGNGTDASDTDRANAFKVGFDNSIKVGLNTSASSGEDHDLYQAINALGWSSDVIE